MLTGNDTAPISMWRCGDVHYKCPLVLSSSIRSLDLWSSRICSFVYLLYLPDIRYFDLMVLREANITTTFLDGFAFRDRDLAILIFNFFIWLKWYRKMYLQCQPVYEIWTRLYQPKLAYAESQIDLDLWPDDLKLFFEFPALDMVVCILTLSFLFFLFIVKLSADRGTDGLTNERRRDATTIGPPRGRT